MCQVRFRHKEGKLYSHRKAYVSDPQPEPGTNTCVRHGCRPVPECRTHRKGVDERTVTKHRNRGTPEDTAVTSNDGLFHLDAAADHPPTAYPRSESAQVPVSG